MMVARHTNAITHQRRPFNFISIIYYEKKAKTLGNVRCLNVRKANSLPLNV